jgi:hypothetical protein
MQKVKVENTLKELIRIDDIVMSQKNFILNKMLEGYKPSLEENYSYYSRKTGEMTKPKTEYRIENNKTNLYYTINKTYYDFANYILENDFLDMQKINSYITAEEDAVKTEEQKQLDLERKEQAEKEAKEQAEKDFSNWLDNQAKNYNSDDKLNLAKEIFLQELGQYNEYSLRKLLILIDNIDNENCRTNLISWLHVGNKTSKKVFYHITGIKLSSIDKETRQILKSVSSSDYTGMIAYKKRKSKSEPTLEKFYKLVGNSDNLCFEEVLAESINKYGLELFLIKTNSGYNLSEARCGRNLTTGNTKEQIFEQLESFINDHGIDKINSIINESVNKYGLSPRYQTVEA